MTNTVICNQARLQARLTYRLTPASPAYAKARALDYIGIWESLFWCSLLADEISLRIIRYKADNGLDTLDVQPAVKVGGGVQVITLSQVQRGSRKR